MSHPGWIFALAMAIGMVCQVAAQHLRLPGIVLLLVAGVLFGADGLGLVQPHELGPALRIIVGLAVSVILFEGGLHLQIDRLRRAAGTIQLLITLGAVTTAAGAAAAAHFVMGWEWKVAVLFGTLVIVTGPTVVTPLLRRIRVRSTLHTILEAEGVLIDPIGALIAVVTLEATLTTTLQSSLWAGLPDLALRLGFGLVVGLLGGFLLGAILRFETLIPEGHEKVLTLALVLALFEASNLMFHESGIVSVTIAGLVVGNMESQVTRALQEFKEELTVMLIGMLFILLAAGVSMEDVVDLGWRGAVTVLLLILVVRPLNIALCTFRSGLGLREKLFLSWLAPRGIVAAAVASIFAHRLLESGIRTGVQLEALVFTVIAVTVTLQGLTSGWVASLLGVRRPQDRGYAIVGANPLARALGHALKEEGEKVVVMDVNARHCSAAEEEGLRVVYGSAHEERILAQADVAGRRGVVGATPNEGLNLLLIQHCRELYRLSEAYVALQRGKPGVQKEQIHEARARVLFSAPVDTDLWSHLLRGNEAERQVWKYAGPTKETDESEKDVPDEVRLDTTFGPTEEALLPLVWVRNEAVRPAADDVRVEPGDRVHVVTECESAEAVDAWMADRHWERVDDGPDGAAG